MGDGQENDSNEAVNFWLNKHMDILKQRIMAEAKSLSQGKGEVEPIDIAEAARRYAPGVLIPDERGFWRRIGTSISGVTIISAILVVLFGGLGLWFASIGGSSGQNPQPYWDIAKVFAGAIVGSTGATVTSGLRRQ